jgi:hypothetical protein
MFSAFPCGVLMESKATAATTNKGARDWGLGAEAILDFGFWILDFRFCIALPFTLVALSAA